MTANNMPELPEVETVVKVLKTMIIGKKITKIDVLRPQTIVGDYKKFITEIENKEFLDITRIGKFLIFHLSEKKVIIAHLRMEGKFYKYNENELNSYYSRVVFHFDSGEKLCYDDSRCFGIMILSDEDNYQNVPDLAKLGPEPFEVTDIDSLFAKLKNKSLPIKSILLDQTFMCGIGNIYADEILYECNIHPLTPAKSIKKEELINIVNNAKVILNEAIELGGSTIKSYHPGKDIDGKFQNRLRAYGKAGQVCPKCGATYRFIKIGGRGTTFCPRCQIKKGAPIIVGLTGKIASGKSTILETFKNENIPTISSDEVVAFLYKQEVVARKIEKLLQISFNQKEVNKDILRNVVSLDINKRRKLERFIHPLVRNQIEIFIKKTKRDILTIEVPLLFESGFDDLCDTIIVCDIEKDKQIELLNARNKKTALLLEKINESNKIKENIGKATYVINNDSTKEDLIKNTKQIINKLRLNLN